MEGPMDRLFGHSAFDLNRDGKIDGAEWAFINDTFFEDNNGISYGSSIDEDDDVLDELDDDVELFDDVFKEEEYVDEPYDDVEAEDGYNLKSSGVDSLFEEDGSAF